jgi:hypothetical protein
MHLLWACLRLQVTDARWLPLLAGLSHLSLLNAVPRNATREDRDQVLGQTVRLSPIERDLHSHILYGPIQDKISPLVSPSLMSIRYLFTVALCVHPGQQDFNHSWDQRQCQTRPTKRLVMQCFTSPFLCDGIQSDPSAAIRPSLAEASFRFVRLVCTFNAC